MNRFVLASVTLFQREVVRFLRQRTRIVGALGTPIVFWFLIGSGLGKSFRAPSMPGLTGYSGGTGLEYLAYFFPGTVALILLFTAIFSTISIIEDRREGFLQGVLVSPAPRSSIVMGKILGGAALATAQGLLFICLAPLLHISLGFPQIIYIIAITFFLSFGLTGLGFLLAWRMDSTQGFHAIMNLFLMPLWFLSGALFPVEGAPQWLKWVMSINPITYGVAGLHIGFFRWAGAGAPAGGYSSGGSALIFSPSFCLSVTIVFSAVMFALASIAASKKQK